MEILYFQRFPKWSARNFDSVPQYPRKIDRGYWGTLSKRKSGANSHMAVRALAI